MRKFLMILSTTLITVILFIEFSASKDASLALGTQDNTLDLYQPYSGKIDLEYLKKIAE